MSTQENFMRDVAAHQMEVIRDDGVHRHLVFRRPDSNAYRFELITFPGYLVYVGDMGAFTFNRLHDMFEFFRDDSGWINPSYWSEKIEATSNDGGHEEHDGEAFRRAVCTYAFSWMRDNRDRSTKDDRRDLWDAICDQVLTYADDEHRAATAAHDFSWREGRLSFQFFDLFEHQITRYTHHFIWCCRALVWGIARYDERKAALVKNVEGGAS